MKQKPTAALVLLTLVLGAPPMVHAAAAAISPERLAACASKPDPAQRLQCFDAETAALKKSPEAPAAPAVAPRPSAPVVAPAPQTAPPTPQLGDELLTRKKSKTEPGQTPSLTAVVTKLQLIGPGTYVIVLANGQVWRLQEGLATGDKLAVGDTVRIEKGSWGSYRLRLSGQSSRPWLRVTRAE